jgi:lipoprotein-releasing system ATP-binding protein
MRFAMSKLFGGQVSPLKTRNLTKSFIGGDGKSIDVLRGVTLDLPLGEAVAIVGASGAGKSTLLHLLGALDRPTDGQVLLGGREVAQLGEAEVASVRNQYVGFVFQFHHLLREFTALENVMMPALLAGVGLRGAQERAKMLLGEVGLWKRESHKPRQLSGGEQQRVAVARALVNEPIVLDTKTSELLHDLIFGLRERREVSFVVVTHNRDLAERADQTLTLEDGRLQPSTQV